MPTFDLQSFHRRETSGNNKARPQYYRLKVLHILLFTGVERDRLDHCHLFYKRKIILHKTGTRHVVNQELPQPQSHILAQAPRACRADAESLGTAPAQRYGGLRQGIAGTVVAAQAGLAGELPARRLAGLEARDDERDQAQGHDGRRVRLVPGRGDAWDHRAGRPGGEVDGADAAGGGQQDDIEQEDRERSGREADSLVHTLPRTEADQEHQGRREHHEEQQQIESPERSAVPQRRGPVPMSREGQVVGGVYEAVHRVPTGRFGTGADLQQLGRMVGGMCGGVIEVVGQPKRTEHPEKPDERQRGKDKIHRHAAVKRLVLGAAGEGAC